MVEQPIQKESWERPQGFIQTDSRVSGIIVYAPQKAAPQNDQTISYACPNCGANVAYDVAAGGVACEYCGYTAPVKAKSLGRSAESFEFTLETISQSNRGWGIERQVMHCDSCGAELSIPQGALSTSCPFCASNQVNLTVSLEELLRPRTLVPFKITPEGTQRIAAEWLGKGWFHPDELSANAILRRFTGIYLPFWTFDARIRASWRAQVGYERTERHYNAHEKRWETRTSIDWRWEDGEVDLEVDDHLVSGSDPARISHTILSKLLPFNLHDLVPYHPDYLAGWQAQAYERTLTEAWEVGKAAIREEAKNACYQDIPTHHVRNFSMTADFSDESWRYILLPIYLTAYKYEDQVYQIMVNGQTGTIAGQKPVAWWKVWLAIAAILAPGTLLILIGLPLILLGGVGLIPLVLGIILFVVGLVFSVILFNKARQSEAK